MTEPFLVLDAVTKTFGPNTVISGIDLAFEKGEFISFIGPSGCGKTTVLRMVAGFEQPSQGSIRIDGLDMTDLPTRQRRLGMVFQAYALFPNMTVAQNIGFGLKVAGMPGPERDRRVAEMLDLIGLSTLGKRYAFELSGGQQQRVALARALAPKPRMLLLDEPLSALDAKIRVSLRDQIRSIQRELGITTIFVTHDQEEAMSISDRIVVMNKGTVEQLGTPAQIYNRPTSPFVAQFVGALNTLAGRIVDAQVGEIAIGTQKFRVPLPLSDLPEGAPVTISFRPEAMRLGVASADRIGLTGKVTSIAFLGSIIRIGIDVDNQRIQLDCFNDRATEDLQIGAVIAASLNPGDIVAVSPA